MYIIDAYMLTPTSMNLTMSNNNNDDLDILAHIEIDSALICGVAPIYIHPFAMELSTYKIIHTEAT